MLSSSASPGGHRSTRSQLGTERYAALESFAIREGHAKVPDGFVEGGVTLGTWVARQRTAYRHKRLSKERIARLEALPGWLWSKRDRQWEEMFALLQRYVERDGHARVPRDHVEGGAQLGEWVKTNRDAYQGKRGKRITPDRIARLESLRGWNWHSQTSTWERKFAGLEVFVKREGHARVPQGFMEGDVALGSWVGRQRAFHRQGRLSQDRVARLEAVQGWQWNPPVGGSKKGRRAKPRSPV